MARRRSGPSVFDIERTTDQWSVSAAITGCHADAESRAKWSSTMTSTCGYSARIACNAPARAALKLHPVGLCARGVTITARAPLLNACSSPSGNIPSLSTPTGLALNPAYRSMLMLLKKQGSSTTTLSPGSRWALSRRSMASIAPLVISISPAVGTAFCIHCVAQRFSSGETGASPYRR